MAKTTLFFIAIVLASLAFAPAGRAHRVEPKARAVLVRERARIDRHLRVKLRIRCIAPAGFVCEGDGWLEFVDAKIAGIPVPITDLRRYKLGAGRERAISFRVTGYARPDAGRSGSGVANLHLSVVLGEGIEDRRVFLSWGRLPARR